MLTSPRSWAKKGSALELNAITSIRLRHKAHCCNLTHPPLPIRQIFFFLSTLVTVFLITSTTRSIERTAHEQKAQFPLLQRETRRPGILRTQNPQTWQNQTLQSPKLVISAVRALSLSSVSLVMECLNSGSRLQLCRFSTPICFLRELLALAPHLYCRFWVA